MKNQKERNIYSNEVTLPPCGSFYYYMHILDTTFSTEYGTLWKKIVIKKTGSFVAFTLGTFNFAQELL